MDLIKREVASVREYYQSRMDADIPPLKEELDRIAAQLTKAQDAWRDGEKRAILAKFSGGDRPRVAFGKYEGLDVLDVACIRSLLNAQLRDPSRAPSPDAGRLADQHQGGDGLHHRRSRG